MIEVKLSGRYRLEAKIGDGPIGAVWRATDEVLDRLVAVKVLHPDLAADDLFRERFRLEAHAAARLTHPNIVAMYDTGEGEGTPFMVMEFLEGGTLRQRLDTELRLPPSVVARIGAEVCAALEHAHAHGIIHRDVKPSNILFTDSGRAKVADFGIAGPPPNDGESSGPLGSHVRYLSPEQVDGAPADARSDVYSLGLVLYEALTGHAPFAGSSDLAAAVKRQATAPARPQRLRPDIPKALDDVVVRALQPAPGDRFADASEMRRALGALAARTEGDDEAPPPAPTPPADEASFVRTEGRWLLPALLAVLLVGVIVVVAIRPGVITRIIPFTGGGTEPETTLTVRDSGAHDPEGRDGGEHNEDVPNAFDGNPATAWRTNSYTTAEFGDLKEGLGIWFDVGEPLELDRIRVSSVAAGWEATIRTSDDGRTWSAPAASEAVGTDHTFDVSGTHRYWMVWITRLTEAPDGGTAQTPFAVSITEIRPSA